MEQIGIVGSVSTLNFQCTGMGGGMGTGTGVGSGTGVNQGGVNTGGAGTATGKKHSQAPPFHISNFRGLVNKNSFENYCLTQDFAVGHLNLAWQLVAASLTFVI